MKYADDTAIFFGGKEQNKVERTLFRVMNRLSESFVENKLLLNLIPGNAVVIIWYESTIG